MRPKLKIVICAGTTCYVMGGASLLALKDHLPEELKDKVIIEGSTCLGYCKEPTNQKPPFVIIGESLISEATLPIIIEKINSFFKNTIKREEL